MTNQGLVELDGSSMGPRLELVWTHCGPTVEELWTYLGAIRTVAIRNLTLKQHNSESKVCQSIDKYGTLLYNVVDSNKLTT
jgi:hypothetical protein